MCSSPGPCRHENSPRRERGVSAACVRVFASLFRFLPPAGDPRICQHAARGLAPAVPIILAGALVSGASPVAVPVAPRPRLTAINSSINRTGVSLVIEASQPAAYVATRPDPLTIYLEFRNVGALGVVNRFTPDARSPIAAVAVERQMRSTRRLRASESRLAQAVALSGPLRSQQDRRRSRQAAHRLGQGDLRAAACVAQRHCRCRRRRRCVTARGRVGDDAAGGDNASGGRPHRRRCRPRWPESRPSPASGVRRR